jgi:hypothetical protein
MEQEFTTLLKHPNYLISTSEPFEIKRKSDGKILKPYLHGRSGYYRVNLGYGRCIELHKIIANQFIPNPNHLPDIDHCDRNKTNNILTNLRWVSYSTNRCNRTNYRTIEYDYFDTLPEGYILFTEYKMSSGEVRKFNNLFIKMENNQPQFLTNDSQHQYRRLYKQKTRDCVCYNDINGKQSHICFSRINKTQNSINTTQQGINQTQQGINTTQQELIKVLNKLTDILERKQTHQEETSDEEYEHFEPDDDFRK